MSNTIEKIINTTKKFQEQQIESFKKFIDTSKKLKSLSQSMGDDAQKNYQVMQASVSSLIASSESEKGDPLEVLQKDQKYVQSLDQLADRASITKSSSEILKYINNKSKETTQYMKTRQSMNE